MKKTTSFKNAQAGVSLVELMVGLTIGLIITGGAMTLLFSNQKMLLSKESLDRTQEGFRFATTTITRMVRQASSFDRPTSNNELIINFDSTQRDCLGQVGISTTNTLKLDNNNQLVCILNKDTSKTYVLAKNIGALQFSYGIQASGAVAYSSYYSSGTTVNSSVSSVWDNITSISTHISLIQQANSNQPTLDFIATSHNIGITQNLSSGGTSATTNSSSNNSSANSNSSSNSSTTDSNGSGNTGSIDNNNTSTNTGGTTNTNTNTGNSKSLLDQIAFYLNISYSSGSTTWADALLTNNSSTPITVTKKTQISISKASIFPSDLSLANWTVNGTTLSGSSPTIKIDTPNGNNQSFTLVLTNGSLSSTLYFQTSK
ncbi:PilW family protein [Acinetobacter brisouii]